MVQITAVNEIVHSMETASLIIELRYDTNDSRGVDRTATWFIGARTRVKKRVSNGSWPDPSSHALGTR